MEGTVTVSRRNAAIGAVVVLALLAGAFFAGRFAGPEKVVTKAVEKVVTKVEFQDRIVEKVVTVTEAAKTEQKVVYIDRVVTKEGEVRERIVEKTVEVERKTEATDANRTETTEAKEDRVVEKVVEKTVTARADWRVGILAGAQWPTPLVPIYGPLVLGAYGERRIIGGFSMGLWLNTGGAAGVSASMEF